MDTYEIIKGLAKEKNISIRQLEMNFDYSNGYIGSWKRQTPKSTELVRLADYFNVSVDYLLGRTDNPSQANDDTQEQQSIAKQIMMRMDTNNLKESEVEEVEKEVERFLKWRLEEIKSERENQ